MKKIKKQSKFRKIIKSLQSKRIIPTYSTNITYHQDKQLNHILYLVDSLLWKLSSMDNRTSKNYKNLEIKINEYDYHNVMDNTYELIKLFEEFKRIENEKH